MSRREGTAVRSGRWLVTVGVALVSLSAALYLVHYAVFKDARHIALYLVGDLAFVPVNTLIVTLFIERLLVQREKRQKLKKLNMVIGAFFSNVGVSLMRDISVSDSRIGKARGDLIVGGEWTSREFEAVSSRIGKLDFDPRPDGTRLRGIRDFLLEKRDFLLRLLENPNLLEHDTFADLLWAVFHLVEELSLREDPARLPEADYAHLHGDVKRAYGLLVVEWLAYMRHLKSDYPYLFSLALRTNPFDPEASPVVK